MKRATYVGATGENERNANLYCIVANGFFSEIMTKEKHKSAASLLEHWHNVPDNAPIRQSRFHTPVLLLGRHQYRKLIKVLHKVGFLDMELAH